jgi:hypothetical protein
VLGGGFGLWLGDNIAILSMVKQAHPLYSKSFLLTINNDNFCCCFLHIYR